MPVQPAPVLIAGTANNTRVGNYIISTLKALDWHIDVDEFSGETPIGVKQFRNIIATKDPGAARRVILAAHYDSKYFSSYPNNQARPKPIPFPWHRNNERNLVRRSNRICSIVCHALRYRGNTQSFIQRTS